MRRHKFIDGQVVDTRPNPCATLAGAYEIVCRLPMNGGDHQYWVRSLGNDGHRVARESDLLSQAAKTGAASDGQSAEITGAGPVFLFRRPM